MSIRRLPNHLVDRIAAGEVVERPASVVKELVENSLDAQAKRIEVRLSGAAGRQLQVLDDGFGMTPADMRLAIERHATSKLDSDDLLAIHSFGFRGEALPAIASVSRFRLESRPDGAQSGWGLMLDGGELVFDGPAGLPPGTRVTVDDLFARVPARAKFLKSARTEVQAVADVVRRLAMAHPGVGFRLLVDDRRVIDVPAEAAAGVAGLADRVRRLLPGGADTVAVDFQRADLVIGGLAGLPAASRSTAQQQYLFVNGRPVRDRQLVGALRGAYAGRLPAGRHALAALFVELPVQDVDVNVHPAKAEVRFREPARIRGSLITAVREALAAAGVQPVAAASLSLAEALQRQAATESGPAAPAAAQAPLPAVALSPQVVPQQPQQGHFHAAEPMADWTPDWAVQGRPADAPLLAPPAPAPAPAPGGEYPLGLARGQVANTYIVAETADALVLVDQHAAHERLVLEAMRGRAGDRPLAQALLVPVDVTLDAMACDQIDAARELLAELGLELERFGPDSMLVRSVPAALGQPDLTALLRDIADDLAETERPDSLTDALEHLAATLA